jgi:hypothetical protein
VAVPNLSSRLRLEVQVPVQVRVEVSEVGVGVVGAASEAASIVAVVASVEVAVGLAEDAEGSETEEDLEIAVAVVSEVVVASEEAEMTLVQGVEVAIGSCSAGLCGTDLTLTLTLPVCFSLGVGVADWATKAVDSMTADRLPAGSEVLRDLVVGPVDQVGLVLPVGAQDSVLPAVGMVATEDISSARAQEVSTTGTPSDHDTRFLAVSPHQGMCKWAV